MKKTISDILCATLILLFVYAGAAKLLDETNFRQQLSVSPIVNAHAGLVAVVLPVVELATAAMLTAKNTRFYGLLVSLVFMTVFTSYIAAMLLSGVHLPCSCGALISSLGWEEHLIFNLFFLGIATVALVIEKKERKDQLDHKHISREQGSKLKTFKRVSNY